MFRQNSFDDLTGGVGRFLGSPTPLKGHAKESLYCAPAQGGFVEITIAHPESAQWLKMTSEKQKRKLSVIFREAIAAIPLTYHKDSNRIFEYSLKGQIHLHGYVRLEESLKCYPVGVVSDIAKAILSNMPKKYSKFVSSNMHGEWCRYRSPQCVVQYRELSEEDRISKWIDYMEKLQ